MEFSFWKNKRVLLTGHTGFKGSWMSHILIKAGAELTGYSLSPLTEPNLFQICSLGEKMQSVVGDIRDRDKLKACFSKVKPEIVIHMAAQPLVRESYKNPAYTYETNVMGVVNLLECVRTCGGVRSLVNVTTDKVYRNNEWHWGYREDDSLDGYDPYSNSKSCSELVTHSYKQSFFSDGKTAISTVRAGNVIGGGDYSKDRIIPDCIQSVQRGDSICVRNPHSVRPYQHVLEPVLAYLLIARRQWEEPELADCYNIGPDDSDCVTTGVLVDLFCQCWANGARWENGWREGQSHEASFLKLDCSKIKAVLDWHPRWNVNEAVEKTVEWTKALAHGDDITAVMDRQIAEYLGENR